MEEIRSAPVPAQEWAIRLLPLVSEATKFAFGHRPQNKPHNPNRSWRAAFGWHKISAASEEGSPLKPLIARGVVLCSLVVFAFLVAGGPATAQTVSKNA